MISIDSTGEILKWNELFCLLFTREFHLEQAKFQDKFSGPTQRAASAGFQSHEMGTQASQAPASVCECDK